MAHRASINQVVQIGVESTPGTPVAASKLLECFTWTTGAKPTTKQFKGTARRYPGASEELTEMASGKIAGQIDYNGCVYPISSVFGAATIALHSGATLANDWSWTPALAGAVTPKTYTLQQGDGIDAEQYAYLMFSGFNYELTRKNASTFGADWFSQSLTDGISLTASPTAIALIPAVGKEYTIYLDSTAAGIGTTALANPVKLNYTGANFFTQFWPINRANASFASHLDADPTNDVKLMLEADTVGMGILSSYLQPGLRVYMRVVSQGRLIENDQIVGVGSASGGTFTLTYKGQTTAGITYNAANSAVQSALRALSTIGATGCTVSGTAPTWTVLMTGALANDTTAITINGAGLTGGTPTVTAQPIYASMTHDMCLFCSDMAEFADQDGVFATEYSFVLAEDQNWNTGQAHKLSITNLLSAL